MKTTTTTATATGQFPTQLRVSSKAKPAIQVLALIAFVTFAAWNARGQGTVDFYMTASGVLSTRVYLADTNYPFWPTFGNTSNQIPAGTQTYSGGLVSGDNYVAQLWAAPGANQPESVLQVASGTRAFRTGGAAGLFFGVVAILTNVPPDCPVATVQLRVWRSVNGVDYFPTWNSALSQFGAVFLNAIGKSPTFNVESIGGGTNPPPNLLNLRSFSLLQNVMDTPVKPIIYVQPQHQTVAPGSNVTFRAETACPAYAPVFWKFHGSDIVSGWAVGDYPTTNQFGFPMLSNAGGWLTLTPSDDVFFGSTLTNVLQLTNVQPSQAGIYSVAVTNFCCSFQTADQRSFALSSNVVLTVGNPGPLTVARDSLQQIILNWDGVFFLQSATNLNGPFTDLPGPVVFSPYTNINSSGPRFFRLRN